MQKKLETQLKTNLRITKKQLWEILTRSEYTQQYMFNCSVDTSWEVGSPIIWQGEFEGYQAYQKGEVLAYEPFKLIQYTTFDPNFGLKDVPDNYIHVSNKIEGEDSDLLLIIQNHTFDGNEERMTHIVGGWQMVIDKIEEIANKKQA